MAEVIKEYTKEDLKLAKAKLLIFEADIKEMETVSELLTKQHDSLLKSLDFIRKTRIRQSKRRYDKSVEGRRKNKERSLRNYHKNKAKMSSQK